MSLFKHRIQFTAADPLGDGLGDEIAHERTEREAITLEETVDEEQLDRYWNSVESDIKNDPEWFHFTEDNE
ncbi:MAG TPA: hypothetical protein VIQ80_02060 [Candidatus Saccharimonadales bacterium]